MMPQTLSDVFCYRLQTRPSEAVKQYEEIGGIGLGMQTHFNVGIAYYAMGDHSACMQALDRASRLPSGVSHHSMYYQQMAACDSMFLQIRRGAQ